jgi:2-polyprenyl-3-methyl-5-hydroxy-6-metoxy-1,4-benzoquinol methylase
MSAIERDFDRLAQFDEEGWTSNNHYHDFLLHNVQPGCENALEIGCGTGTFSRRLARRTQHVTAIDLSLEMIRVARARSSGFANIRFEVADLMAYDFAGAQFDCIASIATLHHMPTQAALVKLKHALTPGGTLLVLDLYEPQRDLLTAKGLSEAFLNLVAMGTSCTLGLMYNGRFRPPPDVRAAWEEHGQRDSYLTINEVHGTYSSTFPGVVVRKHLLWRYSAVWRKT